MFFDILKLIRMFKIAKFHGFQIIRGQNSRSANQRREYKWANKRRTYHVWCRFI